MAKYNYHHEGMCVGIALDGTIGVFEKCGYLLGYQQKKSCASCPKLVALRTRKIVSLDCSDQLNLREVKNDK